MFVTAPQGAGRRAPGLAWTRQALPERVVDRAALLNQQAGQPAARPHALRPLHLNESPYPPSPRAQEAMVQAVLGTNRYPDPGARRLCAALSGRTGVPASRIVCANGSEELIGALCTLGGGAGDEVVVPAPAFPLIGAAAALRGARVLRVPITSVGANDPDGLLAAITPATRIVFCCTPNPPSGGMLDAEGVAQLVRGVPDGTLLVVDEAYHEFGRHDGGPDILAMLQSRAGPWVNLRTFSKAYGLAGARVGYAFCSHDTIADALRRTKTTYGPGVVALAGALAALEDEAYLAQTLEAVARERRRMSDGLRALGLRPFPSSANFVSVALPMPAADTLARLHERGIQVRDWRDPDYQREVRITVGLPEDTDAVLRAVREILTDAPPVSEWKQVRGA